MEDAAASWHGFDVIELLLGQKGDKIETTYMIIQKAAENGSDEMKIIEYLLKRNRVIQDGTDGNMLPAHGRVLLYCQACKECLVIKTLVEPNSIHLKSTRSGRWRS
jgi:hypothetical protein